MIERTPRAPYPPTKRQLEILAFMRDYIEANCVAPTIREICAHFGWTSSNAAADALFYMSLKGMVRQTSRSQRNWRPV